MGRLKLSKIRSKFTGKNLKILILGILALICLLLLSGILLSFTHLFQYGFNSPNLNLVGKFLWRLKDNPWGIFEAYGAWLKTFNLAWQRGQLSTVLFFPFLAPLTLIGLTIWAFVRSTMKRFELGNHFATAEDVSQMGLLRGFIMFLGKFRGRTLKLNRTYSVLAFGESGMGKTSALAIPSILESNKSCVVAIDNSGVLAKYTSGYRAKIGKVFYFDWRLMDNPEKGEYWPRWNPLSARNLPKGGNKRECYLLAVAKSLLSQDRTVAEENYWDRLSHIALNGLLEFFAAKIEQAEGNDYFLSKIMEKGSVFREDRELLLSYYMLMPEKLSVPMVEMVKSNQLSYDSYLPVGSWGGVPDEWQGREMCLPMFTDFLIQRYFLILKNNPGQDAWKILLEEFLTEADLFGYNQRASQKLRQLFYLSKKQRNIVFPMLLKPLTNFRNKTVRDRTCVSDFYLRQSRGIKSPQGNWQVSTVYNVYNNDFMSRFFVDMLVEDSLVVHRNSGGYPLLFVLDDMAKLPKFNSLVDGVGADLDANISFLLIANDLDKVQEIYGTSRLESMISNATFKLLMASSNQKLSEQLEQLAVYGTKSVQIPRIDSNDLRYVKNGLADASYYHRIAQSLESYEGAQFSRGYQLLLAEGYYHRPVRTESEFFLNNPEMIEKSAHRPNCFVALDILQKRNLDDLNPPLLIDILHNSGIKIEQGGEVDEFIAESFDAAVEDSKKIPDQESVMNDEISNLWQSRKLGKAENLQANREDDWWMTEESFVVPAHMLECFEAAEATIGGVTTNAPTEEDELSISVVDPENIAGQVTDKKQSYNPDDPLA